MKSKFSSKPVCKPSTDTSITRTNFKLALKSGFYDLVSARDFYREACTAAGVGMDRDLVLRYIELQALLITPIAPHWAEYVWLELLGKVSFFSNSHLRIVQVNQNTDPIVARNCTKCSLPDCSFS